MVIERNSSNIMELSEEQNMQGGSG